MARLVIDCSVVMSWCFEDEQSAYGARVLNELRTEGAVVPGLFPLEVANALVAAERRRRVARMDAMQFVALVNKLPIDVDGETPARAFGETIALARELGLSAYDAAYLELAVRVGGRLATLDEQLRRATIKIGAVLLEA